MKTISIAEIISQTGCEAIPHNNELKFSGVAPLNLAIKEHISFLINDKYFDETITSNAGAIICSKTSAEALFGKTKSILLISDNPHATLAKVSQFFFKPKHPFSGISQHAIIDETAEIHPSATIFPFVFIGPSTRIGANTTIYSSCFIGAASSIGSDCILYPNVVI